MAKVHEQAEFIALANFAKAAGAIQAFAARPQAQVALRVEKPNRGLSVCPWHAN
jgi:hypothetical protein